MSNIDTIKERVRKLMAVANDGNAPDAEIDSAMRLAAKLLDQHHIDADEIGHEGKDADTEMGQAFATTQNRRFSTWELILSHAIKNLFGCVQCYISGEVRPLRVNGIAKLDDGGNVRKGRKICFYGPAIESREAAELYQDWSASIATMGVARWGGCFRGDGAAYCYGFATALSNKAHQINSERKAIEARPVLLLSAPTELAASSQATAITLSDRYEILRDMGSDWLKKEQGVNLTRGSGRSGYGGTGGEAYREGKQHGTSAHFSRGQKRKMLS